MKIDTTELITYVLILLFIIGAFYMAFKTSVTKKDGELNEGEIVVGENKIKYSINQDVESIEDEVHDIGEMIK